MSRELGPQEDCVQCGESRAAIKESQRKRDPIFCGAVDYDGECIWEMDRHRFIWTKKDEAATKAEAEYWDRAGEAMDRMEQEMDAA